LVKYIQRRPVAGGILLGGLRMKKIMALFVLLGWLTGCAHVPTFTSEPVQQAGTVVWAGLDYSQVRLIGTKDFRKPEEIFPQMFEKWNTLQRDQGSELLEKRLRKKLIIDIDGIKERNQLAKPDQIIRKDGSKEEMVDASHLNADSLAAEVKALKLNEAEGLGLVFIIDRLVKKQETLCFYAVFFNIKTREVVESRRICEPARGFGFEYYWIYPIAVAIDNLKM
jgi:hypothetical protein